MLKNISKLALLGILAAILVGCSGDGAVNVGSVEEQSKKEKEINKAAEQNLPPGDGPAG
ncbi:MAG TPA: hypothetical protein VK171_05055 [Fimbriimonas sp.]|nr:hypothetical protein [Fimbriimonas sp.]